MGKMYFPDQYNEQSMAAEMFRLQQQHRVNTGQPLLGQTPIAGLPPANNQVNNTFGGIYSPAGGPTGGYAMGNPTFTGHTSAYDVDGVSKGFGGGTPVHSLVPKEELLHARPDLRRDNTDAVFDARQLDNTPYTNKVTQVTLDPRAAALRGLSREQSGANSRHKQAAQNIATSAAGEA